VPVTAMRLSYAASSAGSCTQTADQGAKLWDLLWEAPAATASSRPDVCVQQPAAREGYRSFGADMTMNNDRTRRARVCGQARQGEFIGKEALIKRKENVTRKLTCLTAHRRRPRGRGKNRYSTAMPGWICDQRRLWVTRSARGCLRWLPRSCPRSAPRCRAVTSVNALTQWSQPSLC